MFNPSEHESSARTAKKQFIHLIAIMRVILCGVTVVWYTPLGCWLLCNKSTVAIHRLKKVIDENVPIILYLPHTNIETHLTPGDCNYSACVQALDVSVIKKCCRSATFFSSSRKPVYVLLQDSEERVRIYITGEIEVSENNGIFSQYLVSHSSELIGPLQTLRDDISKDSWTRSKPH